MFTGIIEAVGKIVAIKREKGNITFTIQCKFAQELKKGQSVAHNGVCLTVENISDSCYMVTAVKETLSKTNLGKLHKEDIINLERSLKVGDRLDGHFVQGHVDTTAKVFSIKKEKGSWLFQFKVSSPKSKVQKLIIEKGSICVNGVSLTVVEAKNKCFSVTIIPHTYYNTNFSLLKKGDEVNIEFDILGKYLQKLF
jgi:riboflavin synthase